MRIMLDTNIIISMLMFGSKNIKETLKYVCTYHKLVLCSYIIDELKDVVERKFPTKRQTLDDFLLKTPYEIEYTPQNIPDMEGIKIRDENDKPILYSAIIANVDILITGDNDFYSIDIEKPKIMECY